MTIDETIAQEKEMARTFETKDFSEYHEQLAEWLELLKWYEQGMEDIPSESGVLPKDVYHAGYNKAIDDFVEKISLEISESLIWGMIADCFKYKNMNDTSDKIVDYVIDTVKETAERLKAGEKE